jgi:hypothetical protein
MPNVRKIVLRPDAPCPCGSGRPIAQCHLDFDGRLRKEVPSLYPPNEPTGFSHPGCYLGGTADCSAQISREHYMSSSVLQQLGTTLRVSGMPWLSSGETLDTSVASLTAKILCKRHNEALSPLDTEAAEFFSVLRQALIDLKRKTLSRKPILHLLSGEALELWMLKVACGLFFAIGAKGGVKLSLTHAIDIAKVQLAFFRREWDARAGLYFRGHTGMAITVEDNVQIAPLIDDQEHRFAGAVVSLHGFTLEVLLDDKNSNPGQWTGLVKRPSELILRRKQRQHSLILTWPPGTPEASIQMDEKRP